MLSRKVKIINDSGIHARPGKEFVNKAKSFKSDIFLESNGIRVKGTSLLKIMTLGLKKGIEVEIIANGLDEEYALEALADFLGNFKD